MDKLILASSSPRRKEILEKFHIPFCIKPSPYIEIFTDDPPDVQVLNMSGNKIRALLDVNKHLEKEHILGADTCINLDGRIIGKPKSKNEAREFLIQLSGRSHEVITGLTLYNGKTGEFYQDKSTTDVFFAQLTETEIDWYLGTDEWNGAAGAYMIQGQGSLLIKSISGCWYNVMGLPIRLFYVMVASQGLTLFRT